MKAYDTLRALRPLGGRLDPAAAIVSLQNGLGNEEAIKAALGSVVALVVGATTEMSITEGDGVAERIGEGRTVIGSAGASSATVEQTAALIASAGLDVRVAYDIRSHLWGKLIANAAINPLSALLDCPSGTILEDADASSLARAIALESAAVAQAARIKLPFADAVDVRARDRRIDRGRAQHDGDRPCRRKANRDRSDQRCDRRSRPSVANANAVQRVDAAVDQGPRTRCVRRADASYCLGSTLSRTSREWNTRLVHGSSRVRFLELGS